MEKELIEALVTRVVVPEVIGLIKRRLDEGKPVPTAAEAIAELNLTADRIIATGEAFLAE